MTAVDQAGNEVARYRLNGRTVQITVHQELTDALALAIALSAPWLHSASTKATDPGRVIRGHPRTRRHTAYLRQTDRWAARPIAAGVDR